MASWVSEDLLGGNFTVSGGILLYVEGAAVAGLEAPGDHWTPPQNYSSPRVINTDQKIWVYTWFHQTGPLGKHLDPAHKYTIDMYLEKIGPGEFALPAGVGNFSIPFVQSTNHFYWRWHQIPPRTVPEGIYKTTAVRKLVLNNEPFPAVAFTEGEIVQIYED